MDKEAMVRKAVELAKKQGVLFTEDRPSFRPKNDIQKRRFCIGICTNTRPDSSGIYPVDVHFSFLDGHNEKTLANCFIDIYNEYNIDLKAANIK